MSLISDQLRAPWDLEFLPGGAILVTEKEGQLIYIEDGKKRVSLRVDTIALKEAGLLGLAIDPDFGSNGYIYVYYTYEFDISDPSRVIKRSGHRRIYNKIERLTFTRGTVMERTTILDTIPGSLAHAGGRLEFGPDGQLYATTGDGSTLLESQNPSSLLGKILRMNPDGTVPPDNPYPGSYVYSMGHRNPQGLAWHPTTKILYASEHGPWRFDEINRILAGQNYGWRTLKCDEKNRKKPFVGDSIPPVICFKQWTMAPSGMEFVADGTSPWFGDLFVAGLRGGHVHRYVFDNDEIVASEIFFVSVGKDYITESVRRRLDLRIRDVEHHDGALYFLGDHFGLVRVEPRAN